MLLVITDNDLDLEKKIISETKTTYLYMLYIFLYVYSCLMTWNKSFLKQNLHKPVDIKVLFSTGKAGMH